MMRIKYVGKLFIMVWGVFLFGNSCAQQGLGHIFSAYPNWKTNFKKHSVDFSEIRSGGPPKDGIPAIFSSKFVSITNAKNWLDEKEPVIALEIKGEAKAYPLQILIWHEIANDKVGDIPVAVTFCPLCYSAIVFNRNIKGKVHKFGVSGLLRYSDMVMYDDVTESFWQQFTGEAIVGDMLGTKLEMLPSQIISFKQFSDIYPNGKVLSKETGYSRSYGVNPYVGYDDIDTKPFLYDGPDDGRLLPNEKVIAIKEKGITKAYPYSITQNKKVVNDKIGNVDVVVFHAPGALSALDNNRIENSKESGSTGVFNPVIEGQKLNFYYKDGHFFDSETNSKWNVAGKSIEGKLKGKNLQRIVHGDYFAFAWLAFRPDTEIYGK